MKSAAGSENDSEVADHIIGPDDLVLVTGASGYIGLRLVESLFRHGLRNVRCLARPSGNVQKLEAVARGCGNARLELIRGNLLSPEDCLKAVKDVAVIYHLAAGTGTTSFPDAFMNSVVTTRNLLEATLPQRCLKRFVNVSSFTVYSNRKKLRRFLDESSPVEERPELRGDAYCYAKVKQDELLAEYGETHGVPYVILRPGVVYGPGKQGITGRVGIGTFGLFLHLGGSNAVPLTYVENCADAIALAGLRPGIEGEVFNVVDDDLPSSRKVLRLYKKRVGGLKSVYLPHWASYLFFWAWEKYSSWSEAQLPPVFNRRVWHAYWRGADYTNQKLKRLLGWSQRISTKEGLQRYLEDCRAARNHA